MMKKAITKSLIGKWFTLGLLLSVFAIPLKAQVASYSFTSSSGTYSSVGLGADLTPSGFYDDNNFAIVTLPFTFTYAGTPFTTIGVSANGYTKLGAVTTTVYSNQLGTLNNCLAPFASDLYGNTGIGGDISYAVNGTAPNRVFTIQWKNWGFYSTALNEASFQLKLYETSNTVQMVYGNCPGTTTNTVQVGLTGASTADFNDRTTTTNWSATTAGAVNSATCSFQSGVVPASGQTFTWTSAATVAAMAFTSSTGLYVPIQAASASTVLTTASGFFDDNNFAIATIPFTFTYSGTPFTTIGISANGYTKLGSVTTTVYTGQLASITNCIAGFAQDLYGNCTATNIPADISYNVVGTAPNRQFVIQWTRWGFYSTGNNETSFQIRLAETTNAIQVMYGNSPALTSTVVQVGLTGTAVTDFNDRTTTTSWAATTAGGTNTATNTFSPTVAPASGQTYTWLPPTTLPTITSFTPSPICPGGTVVITGTNFTGTTAVNVNGTPVASFVVNSATQITATTTLTNTSGVITITNATGSGTSATSLIISTIPVISSVTATPSSICSGGSSQLLANANIPTLVKNYAYTNSTGATLDPMVGATTVIGTGDDDTPTAAPAAIGFNFYFNGVSYSQYSVSPDGWILLGGTTASNQFSNAVTSTTNTPKIYPYWDDLATGTTGNVQTLVTGSAPNRILKVQWFVTSPRATGGPANATFQAWLYEATGVVEFRYGTLAASGSASIGMTGNATNFQSITLPGNTVSTSSANDVNNAAPASGTMFTFTPPSATFAWSPATFLNSTTIFNPMASAVTATTTYTVVASNAGCPSAGSTVTLTAGTALSSTSTVSPASTVCQGTNVTLNAVPTGGGAPYTYSWTGPGGYTSTLSNPVINGITPAQAGTYSLSVTDNCAAVSNSQVTVTVNPLPAVSVTPTTANICMPGGSAVTLTASGASTYSWLPVAGLTPSTGAVVSALPAATTTYTVTGTDGNGCVATATSAITISETPTMGAVTATPSSVCTGGSSQLTASATLSGGYTVSNPAFSTQACQSNPGPVGDDVIQGNNAIGFTFNYFGTDYTQFAISTNGNIQIGDGSGNATNPFYSTAYTDVAIPNASVPNNMIALAWDDWLTSTPTDITWGVLGSAPNRKLVVCYNTTGRGNGIPDTLIGQIVLEETTNMIYLNITKKGIQPSNTATQGIENAAGNSSSVGVIGRQSSAWNVNIASGDSRVFTPAAMNYSWSPITFLNNPLISNPMASGITSSTTYTVTASASGCSTTGTVTITAGSPLTSSANITPAPTVCAGTDITLNSSPVGGGAPYTYSWSGPNGFTSTASNPVITGVTTADAGTYSLTVTDACTVVSTASVTLAVNPLPVVTVTPTNATYCIGGTAVTLTASGATAYFWGPSAGLSGTTTASVDASPAAGTTYSVTGTDVNGCTATATTTIAVGFTPSVTATSTPTVVCSGGTATLDAVATVAPTYCQPTYSNGTGFGDFVSRVVCNTLDNTTGASASPYYTLYPAVGATTTSLVAGNTYTISLRAGTYTSNDLAAFIDYNQNGNLNDAGEKLGETDNLGAQPAFTTLTFTVPVTALNGTVRLRVREMDHGGSNDIDPCLVQSSFGEVEDYDITITGGVNDITYTWSPATFLGSTTGSSVTASGVNATTTYMVTATTSGGCASTANTSINVNALPTVTANSTATAVCEGSPVTLTGGGAVSYTWDNSVTDGVAFSPVSTVTYMVTGTDVNGCTNTATTTVTVNPLPTVVANATPTAVCTGSSLTLTGSGATSYTWDNSVTDGVAFNPSATTTYMVTGTDVNGCVNTATVSVAVNPLPTVTATSTASVVCSGSSVTLTGGGATSYTWDNSVTDGVAFNPAATTTYMVTGTDANGCSNTATTTVTVNPLPTVTANSTVSAICAGGSVTLTGGGATSYTWDNSVTDGVSFVPATTLTYMVTGTDANGCVNTATTTVTVNALPTVDIGPDVTQCGGTVTLDAGNAGSTYLWSDNSNSQTLVVSTSGSYYVDLTDVNGCMGSDTAVITINTLPTVTGTASSNTVCFDDANVALTGTPAAGTWSGTGVTGSSFDPSAAGNGSHICTYTFTDVNGCTNTATTTIQVNACTGIVENVATSDLSVYPNPNNGHFTIAINNASGNGVIEIQDALGQIISSENVTVVNGSVTKEIDLGAYANGIYFVRFTTTAASTVQKVSVQK